MDFELTLHASQVIADREIRIEWIKQVIESPELIQSDAYDPELTHYLAKVIENGNRVLRVILNTTVTPNLLITVYFDRTMKGKL